MSFEILFILGFIDLFLINHQFDCQITPQDYVIVHRLACESNSSSELISKQDEYRDKIAEHTRHNGCSGGSSGWRWKYFDEQEEEKTKVLLVEPNIDKRLANIVYTVAKNRMADNDAFNFNSGDTKEDLLNMERVAGSQVNDTKCRYQLEGMLVLMENLRSKTNSLENGGSMVEEKHIRLAQVLDSFGRYDSNHLTGRYISMGSYEQCQRSQLMLPKEGENSEQFELSNMRFCWARHRLDSLLDESLLKRPKVDLEVEANVILSGICIPESCHSKSFWKFRKLFVQIASSEFKLPKSMYANESLEVESVFCLVDKSSPLAQVPLVGMFVFLSLVAFTLLASIVTWKQSNQRELPTKAEAVEKQSYFDAFNLVRSWNEFVEVKKNNGANQERVQRSVELDALSCFKVIGIINVIWTHSAMFWIGFSMDTIYTLPALERNSAMLIIYANSTIVDSFFVISGILTTYLAMKQLHEIHYHKETVKKREKHLCNSFEMNKINSIQIKQVNSERSKISNYWFKFAQRCLYMSLKRYLRIAPGYMIWYWFRRSVLLYTYEGPMWDYGLNKNTPVGSCIRDPWYVPLTPISAYQPMARSCMPASWTISNEILFSLISSPIILFMYKRPKLVTIFIFIISLASCALGHFGISKLDAEFLYKLNDLRGYTMANSMTKYSHLYTRPEYRIFAIFIGCLGGYKLFKYDEKQKKKNVDNNGETIAETPIFNGWPTRMLNWLSILYVSAHYILVLWSQDIKHLIVPFQAIIFAYWLNWSRLLWALLSLYIFLRMMTDWKHTNFVRFCAAKFWTIQSKLIFCILLIHVDLIAMLHYTTSRTIKSSMLLAIVDTCGVYLLSSLVSVSLYVLFETPIRKFFNSILQRQAE